MRYSEAVMRRKSQRTYEPGLTAHDSRQIDQLVSRLPKRHFGAGMISVRRIDCPEGIQPPGTYGCIGGARHYLAVYTSESVSILTYIDCGMISELIALYATDADLGTCLMTGSLRDSQFATSAGLSGADSLLLATPIGRARKPRLAEVILSKMARSTTRMPLDKLVFTDRSLTTPWQAGPDDSFLVEALEGLRRAPSAFNRQPWRVVVCPDHIEIHCVADDAPSWISIGCAATNYCAMIGIRSDDLTLDGTPQKPIIIAPRP